MVPVAKDEMVLIAGSSSPLAGRRNVRVRDLDGMEFIFFDKVFPSRRYIDEFLRSHKIKYRVKMELDREKCVAEFKAKKPLPDLLLFEEKIGGRSVRIK